MDNMSPSESSQRIKPGTIRDVDNNLYNIITIDGQVWMAENLKTTRFNDKTKIPLVTDYDAWAALSTPGYSWYNNDKKNATTYGALYNWYTLDASRNGNKNVCPTGWHIPSHGEWLTLINYLGGEFNAGSKLKEAGTAHWQSPNTGATNESGFTALPGGLRYINGTFYDFGEAGYWWSSTEDDGPVNGTYNAWYVYMNYSITNVGIGSTNEQYGLSVRCLKD